jgi:hypothetical protein
MERALGDAREATALAAADVSKLRARATAAEHAAQEAQRALQSSRAEVDAAEASVRQAQARETESRAAVEESSRKISSLKSQLRMEEKDGEAMNQKVWWSVCV